MPTHPTAGPPPPDVPVVIVGAGPVGLTAALLLARRGVRTLILERHPRPYPLPRAVHLDDEARRILQQAGITDAFTRISRPAAGLRLLAADHRVIAEFRRDQPLGRHGHPPSTLFDQPDLEHLLRTELARYPQAELRTGVEVTGLDEITGRPARLRLHHRPYPHPDTGTRPEAGPGSVTASAVIGCDGAQSTVRGFVGARLEDLGFEERWLVLDGRCAAGLNVWDGVDQVCDPRRPATSMRIGPDRYRWEFRLNPGETVTDLTAPPRLRDLLRPWTGDRAGQVQVLRAIEYTFAARLADHWRRGRVFLAGDAAHLTPPFIGQGLGSGLRDVHNLTWKLALTLDADEPDDERLLDSYQSERRPHARALIRLAVLTGWAMSGGQDRAATVRRVLLAGFCRVPGATTTVLDRPGPPLTGSVVVRRRWRWRDPAGTLVPQPRVTTTAGEQCLDDVLGPGFAVLADGPVHADLARTADRLGLPVLRLDPGGEIRSPQLRAWMRRHRAGAVLIRPDRVVLAAARAAPGHPVGADLATVGRTTIRSHWVALLGMSRPLG